MAEVKLRCLVCGSTELESTNDGYECANCAAILNYTSSYMNHLALFDKLAVYVKNGDFTRANRVIEELLKCSRTCPETYWYMILTEYGIRYIDGECCVTLNKDTPIVSSENYKNALKFSGYYMEKFFKAKVKEFEQSRIGVAQKSIDDNAATNTIIAEPQETILSADASIFNTNANYENTSANTLIKDSFASKDLDDVTITSADKLVNDSKKESGTKGVTLNTADYVHKGHNHCEANDGFDALELEYDGINKTDNGLNTRTKSIIEDDVVNHIDLFSDDFIETNSKESDNLLVDIINERTKQKKKQYKAVAYIIASICVVLSIVNAIILTLSREPIVQIIFFSLLSSIAGILLCSYLDKEGKTKIVPIVAFIVNIIMIIVISILNIFNV